MPFMQKILEGIKVDDMINEINAIPQLWNKHTLRTQNADSPHREVSDIWLRYRDYAEFDENNPQNFANEHESVWYPAAYQLPAVREAIEKIAVLVDCDRLGGCLITKVPPGKQVYPHSDAGHWHSEYYLSKYLLLLQSAPQQTFEYHGEIHVGEAGDLFIFDNRPVHWVMNDSDVDRISLIMAIRQKGY